MKWKGSDRGARPGTRSPNLPARRPDTGRAAPHAGRFWKFLAVSAGGLILQSLLLCFLLRKGLHPLPASLLGVEGAILHNLFWHRRWTWRERPGLRFRRVLRRFHITNGLTSLLGNALIISICLEYTALGPFPSSLIAVAVCGIANYLLADRYAFRADTSLRRPGPCCHEQTS